MGPAQERFDRDHLARSEVDHRLVVQGERALGHGDPQVLDQLEAVGLVVERGLVDVEGAPLVLGSVHGDIGAADQVIGRRRMQGGQGHADAGADMQAGGADVDGLLQQRGDAARHRRRLVGVGPVQDDGELVATQARHQVVATDDLANAWSDLAEERVSGLVPERVVDLLEVVEIDQQEGQAARLRAALGQRAQGLCGVRPASDDGCPAR